MQHSIGENVIGPAAAARPHLPSNRHHNYPRYILNGLYISTFCMHLKHFTSFPKHGIPCCSDMHKASKCCLFMVLMAHFFPPITLLFFGQFVITTVLNYVLFSTVLIHKSPMALLTLVFKVEQL